MVLICIKHTGQSMQGGTLASTVHGLKLIKIIQKLEKGVNKSVSCGAIKAFDHFSVEILLCEPCKTLHYLFILMEYTRNPRNHGCFNDTILSCFVTYCSYCMRND